MMLDLTWCLPVDLCEQEFSLPLEVSQQALITLCAFAELPLCQRVVLVQLLLELIHC